MSKVNIMVFIDYENLHYNLINNFKNIFELNLFEKLKAYLLKENYNILNMIAYSNFDLNDMYNSYHQTKLHQIGVETRHTSSNGKNFADIQITTDILENIHLIDNLDGIVLISNDKDMTALIKAVKKYKDMLFLITTKNDIDKILLEYSTIHKYIEDILEETEYVSEYNFKEVLYKNLNDYIKKFFIDRNYPALISLDKYLENATSYNKVFEYEILRNLGQLEQEGLILVHKYLMHGKEYFGIITKDYKETLETKTPLVVESEYINGVALNKSYKNFQK